MKHQMTSKSLRAAVRALTTFLLAALLIVSGTILSFARTESRTKITSVSLSISAELGEASDFSDMSLSITGGSGSYSVGDYEVTNETDNSAYPVVEVTLYAASGYYFSVSTRDVHLSGEEADCTNKHLDDDDETLVLKLKLTDLTSDLPSVSSADFDSDGNGSWRAVPGARKYELRLYRNNSLIGSTKTTSDTEYDFGHMMTRRGDYYFRVRAVGSKSSNKSDWTESNERYFDEALSDNYDDDDYCYNDCYGGGPSGPGNGYNNNANSGPGAGPSGGSGGSSQGNGSWYQNQNGWYYRFSNGTYPVNTWLFADNNWFHFDGNGYMQTGWIIDNGRWFYLNPNSDGTKGKMITGWYWIDGKCYYFNPVSDGTRGALMTNTVIDGKYRLGSDGAWIQ